MNLSVAYQGGGARVVELMAAVVACREQEGRGAFKVTRVSGASAGAIAAAMHVTDCDIGAVIAKAATLKAEVLQRFPASRLTWLRIVGRVALGQPIYGEADLRLLILKLFEIGGVDAEKPIRDLVTDNRELRILRSDIRFGNSPTATETSETRLVDALVDSAAIPFAFRMPRHSSNPEILDGGLFQNLPARAAMEDLPRGDLALGFSFEKSQAPDLRSAKPLAYALAILNSLLSERIDDAAAQIRPANIVTIPNRRSTFDFASMFGDDLAATFSEDVASIGGALSRWKRGVDQLNGPDWHSTHPADLAEQAIRTQEAVTGFYDIAANFPFHADFIHHEVVYQSFNDEMPDIYRLTTKFQGHKNLGLQFLKFFFYDSDEGPIKQANLQVLDGAGNPRNTMILPFKVPGKRTLATLVCLDRPLADGEDITVIKTQESFSGMLQYSTEGFGFEQLSLSPGRRVDEVSIIVHFPTAHRPSFLEDASEARTKDAALLAQQTGLHLPTRTTRSDAQRAGCETVTSTTTETGPAEQRRYVNVVYYKLN